MRPLPAVLALATLASLGTTVEAGGRRQRQAAAAANPLVAPNGVVTPAWAARRMENSPVPLSGFGWGRRPWAFPLAQQGTPSANMARADQLGIGAGPVPGYTNGPPLGNYPTAPVGPTGTLSSNRGILGYPFNIYLNGD